MLSESRQKSANIFSVPMYLVLEGLTDVLGANPSVKSALTKVASAKSLMRVNEREEKPPKGGGGRPVDYADHQIVTTSCRGGLRQSGKVLSAAFAMSSAVDP